MTSRIASVLGDRHADASGHLTGQSDALQAQYEQANSITWPQPHSMRMPAMRSPSRCSVTMGLPAGLPEACAWAETADCSGAKDAPASPLGTTFKPGAVPPDFSPGTGTGSKGTNDSAAARLMRWLPC